MYLLEKSPRNHSGSITHPKEQLIDRSIRETLSGAKTGDVNCKARLDKISSFFVPSSEIGVHNLSANYLSAQSGLSNRDTPIGSLMLSYAFIIARNNKGLPPAHLPLILNKHLHSYSLPLFHINISQLLNDALLCGLKPVHSNI